MIMCDTIFSNSYSYILICFCSNLIVRIWFFHNGNLFLCYRFVLFLELSSQIDCYSLLDKNFLLTTVATRNYLSCNNKHSIYILSLHVVQGRTQNRTLVYDKQQQITVAVLRDCIHSILAHQQVTGETNHCTNMAFLAMLTKFGPMVMNQAIPALMAMKVI